MKAASLGNWLPVALLFTLPLTALAQGDAFPIATNAVAMSCAWDGNNYLVGLENHQTSPPTIGAQMLSANGGRVGSFISTGRSGIATAVAFDGVNYLLIWEDDEFHTLNGDTGWQVYGQRVSKAGTTVGAPFAISTTGIWFDGMKTLGYGGGKHLVTYTRLIDPASGDAAGNRYIAGRMVNPDATMGGEFRISTGNGAASEVAFDGTNFFVVWREDYYDQEIRGRFVSPAGVVAAEILVNNSAAPSDNPKSLAFDGTNYLVVWNDEIGGAGTWDVFGQLVSPSGALVGGVIAITAEPGPQLATGVSFDGVGYLATWTDMQNGTNWDVYGQCLSRSGARLGSKITLSADAGNQLGGAGFANGQYLVLVNNGVLMGPNGIDQVDSATGKFIAPAANPRIQMADPSFGVRTNRFGFTITGIDGLSVIVDACTNATCQSWTPVATNLLSGGTAYFSDAQWQTSPRRFYRLRLP